MGLVSKKITGKLILMVLVLSLALVGCTQSTIDNEGNTSNNSEVMGEVNGVEITREMLGEALIEAEETVVSEYINNYLLKDYYKDIEVSDIEVEAQFAILKGQIGEVQWESYLEYIGMADEDAFKEAIREDLKGSKKRDSLKESIEVTEEEIEEHYTNYKSSFDLLVGQIIFFDTDEEYEQAKVFHSEGKTLDDISNEMGKEIYKDEHVSFDFQGFEVPMEELNVGDTVFTREDSGALAIMTIEKIDKNLEILKETVKDDILNQKAQEMVNEELETMYSEAKVIILGEEIQ